MSRFLVIGDVHLSDRPPSIRTASYADDVLAKLAWCVAWAAANGCTAIFLAGDLLHIKSPSRTSHALVQRIHEVLTASDLPVFVVPGNHDMQHDRIESLDSQPLGALCRMRGVEMLIGEHDTLPVFGLPYLADWGDALESWMKRYQAWAGTWALDEGEFPLMVTHAPIFPHGIAPLYDYIDALQWAEMMGVGACYYGHIHESHGYYQPDKATPVLMGNVGAISRGSLHEETLKRRPAVTVFDSAKPFPDLFGQVEVPHRPVDEVFALAVRRAEKAEQARLTDFLDGLGDEAVAVTSLEAVMAHVGSLELSTSTREVVKELVEWAATK